MQLTDPGAEAAMDIDGSSDSDSMDDDGPDDATLDEMQAAEAAVRADAENYEAHSAVRPSCDCPTQTMLPTRHCQTLPCQCC